MPLEDGLKTEYEALPEAAIAPNEAMSMRMDKYLKEKGLA